MPAQHYSATRATTAATADPSTEGCDRKSAPPFIFVQVPHTGTVTMSHRLELDHANWKRCAAANCLEPYPNFTKGERLLGYVQQPGRTASRCPDPTQINTPHVSSEYFRSALGQERWAAAFKIAFVRTPWQRVLSAAAYKKVIPPGEPPRHYTVNKFRAWIHSRNYSGTAASPSYGKHQVDYMGSLCLHLLVDNQSAIGVDYLTRTSQMGQIYPMLGRRLRFPAAQLDRTHCLSSCSAHEPASWIHWYDALSWRIVAERFACDLTHFNQLLMADVEEAAEELRSHREVKNGTLALASGAKLKAELEVLLRKWHNTADEDVMRATRLASKLEHLT